MQTIRRISHTACPHCERWIGERIARKRSRCWDVNARYFVRRYSTKKAVPNLGEFPVERVRNFSIIAHVDHGKSTLADRLLELTGVIAKDSQNAQVLDRLQVERERGITVKAQTASLFYEHLGITYLLNLIDTPGHVDFNYEVSRSLAACQGVILLVDANQGVQAQTVANFFLALEQGLNIIPVLNKIDLKLAKPEVVLSQLHTLFDIRPDQVLKISAKHGTGVDDVLSAIVDRIPAPSGDRSKPLKALLFDSWYDQYRGAVADIALLDGVLRKGEKITAAYSKKSYEVMEVGFKYPEETPTDVLYAGQVGYVIANMKNTSEARVGDTLYHQNSPVEPLPGFKPATPMVFAGIYPSDQSEYNSLRSAIDKLTLNDSSVSVHGDSSPALGQGWRLGFLGLLHMDVFTQRLEQEHNTSVIVTSPNVPFKVKISGAKNIKKYGGEEITVLNPCHLPDPSIVEEYREPIVLGTIISPDDYIGEITTLCLSRRGELKDQSYIDNKRVLCKFILPLNEILLDFFDELKSITSGYASFDYEEHGYQVSDLVKLTIMINGKDVDELTLIAHVSQARLMGKQICARLRESIPRQLFAIALQAAVGGKIVAREDVRALKKDVLAKCYGGDISRKMKLLKRQAEGKKKMRSIGNVQVPKDAFVKVLRR